MVGFCTRHPTCLGRGLRCDGVILRVATRGIHVLNSTNLNTHLKLHGTEVDKQASVALRGRPPHFSGIQNTCSIVCRKQTRSAPNTPTRSNSTSNVASQKGNPQGAHHKPTRSPVTMTSEGGALFPRGHCSQSSWRRREQRTSQPSAGATFTFYTDPGGRSFTRQIRKCQKHSTAMCKFCTKKSHKLMGITVEPPPPE